MDSIDTNLIYYSHLIPIFFSIFLGFLVLVKGKASDLSRIFFAFTITFIIWLAGDLIAWTSNNYYIVYSSWSLLDFFEIIFYILGFYFATVFVLKRDMRSWKKILLFIVTIPPLIVTLMQNSVTGFYYPACEAFNNKFLSDYKLFLEIIIVTIVFIYILIPFIKKTISYSKKSAIWMLGAIFLFLSVFGVTEFLAATSGNYEIHLYSLFVIPLFLIAITYSIFTLDVFNIKVVSTYFLVFGSLILTGSQLLFISDNTDRLLSILTVLLSVVLSFFLFRNLKKESNQRIQIERLNVDLEKLIAQKESLMHLINHKVKGAFTHSKYIFSEMIEGRFGPLTPELSNMASLGLESGEVGVETIDLILNASNLQKGLIQYEMKPVDFRNIVTDSILKKSGQAEQKNLKLEGKITDETCMVNGDAFWLKEVANNLIENSIRYTNKGTVDVILKKENGVVSFIVKDTGVGITEEDKKKLFTEGGRGKNSVKTNVDSTGYGLYTVKLIVEAHKGKVWVESEGQDKGSTFFVELSAI
jgi:signal transduction histidine kinase